MHRPIVYLVGAGPGDPGLLTLRGRECLEAADFVLYDQLVSSQILRFAPPHAELMCVRELASNHPDRWPQIHVKLIEEARKGKCVVRLKGGDPLIFGRGGEEADALREAGIPYEIVPGVTAALAAGSYLEIPLTHRTHSSAVALITGHEHPGKPHSKLDWKAIAAFPGTLVIYMGFSRLSSIVPELIRYGKSPDTPAISVMRASCGEQLSVQATLGTIEQDIIAAGLTTPALLMVGPVVGLKPAKSWFEKRPLLGKRILVTRPRKQALDFVHQLELRGAIAVTLPVIDIRPPADWSAVDLAQETLAQEGFDWLVFTSANGVEHFFDRLHSRGRDARSLGRTRIAVVGSATAAKLAEYHLLADVAPDGAMNSELLIEELHERARGKRILLALAAEARDLLREQLSVVATVTSVVVYRQQNVLKPDHSAFDRLRRGEIDCVTLTSPNIALAFLEALDETIRGRIERGEIQLAANSERCATVIRRAQLPVSIVAEEPTNSGMLNAICLAVRPTA